MKYLGIKRSWRIITARLQLLVHETAARTTDLQPNRGNWLAWLRLANRVGRRYLHWEHSWKVSSVVLVVIFVVTLGGWSMLHTSAATAPMLPNGDVTAGWVVTGGTTDSSCAGGIHCDFIDDGATDNDTDYVSTGTNGVGGEIEEYALSSPSSVASASQVVVTVRLRSVVSSTADTVGIALRINGTLQAATTVTPTFSFANYAVTYNGSWTQADVDSMQVYLIRNVVGTGPGGSRDDNVYVSNVSASLTYVASVQYNQSAYRWFGNQDAAIQPTFVKAYGGAGAESSYSLIQTSDGGYATTGSTTSYGDATNGDMLLTKYDAAGNPSWSRTWGGTGTDRGNSLIQTSDGGYAITGNTDSYFAGGSLFLAKYDKDGVPTWSRTWGGTSGGTYATSLIQTSDGGYAITGYTYSFGDGIAGDLFLAKFDAAGNATWSRTVGDAREGSGRSLIQTSDGGYAITGYTASYSVSSTDMFLAKFDGTGNATWSRTWGGTGDDQGYSLIQTSDGGYAITGYTASYGVNSTDMFLAKFDGTGNATWSRTWGGAGADYGYSLIQTSDGGYAITGYTASYGVNSTDMFLAKYDSTGGISGCTSPVCRASGTDFTPVTQSSGINFTPVTQYSGTDFTPTVKSSGTDFTPTVKSSGTDFTPGTSSPAVTTTIVVAPSPDIDVTTPLASQDTAATAPPEGTIFRLRLDLHVSTAQADTGFGQFKLRYAAKTALTCDAEPTGNYKDVTDSSTIRYADNPIAQNGQGIVANAANDPQHGTDINITQSYQEKGTAIFTNPNTISIGQDGMWDFALVANHATQNTHYCLKVTNADDSDLSGYTVVPEIIIPASTVSQGSYRFFANQDGAKSYTFANAYGGSNNDSIYDTKSTPDGGYVTVGFTQSYTAGMSDTFIAKYDAMGNMTWMKVWGGAGNDTYRHVTITSDGGYAVTGNMEVSGYGTQIVIAKYDSLGNRIWSDIFGTTATDETGYSIAQTSDGGYVVAGNYGSAGDGLLARYTAGGTQSWVKTITGAGSEVSYGVIQTADGGFAVAGSTTSYGGTWDGYVATYTADGTLVWMRTFGGTGTDIAYGLVQAGDGSYMVTGYVTGGGLGAADIILVKYTTDGVRVFSKAYGGTGNEAGYAITATSDGGYAVTGFSNSWSGGSFDFMLAKFDGDANLTWMKTFGGTGTEQAWGIDQTSDGGYIVGGYGNTYTTGLNDMTLARFDENGVMAGCGAICKASGTDFNPSTLDIALTYTYPSPTGATVTPSEPTDTISDLAPTPLKTIIVVAGENTAGIRMPVGAPFAEQDSALELDAKNVVPFRLRLNLDISTSGIATSGQNFKLQYLRASDSTCSAVAPGYADVTTATPIRFYDNPLGVSGYRILSDVSDPTGVDAQLRYQTYQESNPFTNAQSEIYAQQSGLWDFSLAVAPGGATRGTFCLRAVYDTGSVLTAYDAVPQINVSPTMDQLMRAGNWFSRAGVKQNLIL